MATRVFDPLRLDVQVFASDAGALSGHWPLRAMTRLAESLHAGAPTDMANEVAWSAQGEQRVVKSAPQTPTRTAAHTAPHVATQRAERVGSAQVWLHLRARACLRLECQRCLQAVETDLSVDRWFHFVPGEDAAAQLDTDSEDDVLALTRALDLRELVEDELLLALPLVPRHAECPAPLLAPNDAPESSAEPANPFAALATLKRGGSLN